MICPDLKRAFMRLIQWNIAMKLPVRALNMSNPPFTDEELALRLALQQEEVGEVARAIRRREKPERIAEEVCDAIWVFIGTAVEMGLPLLEAWERVIIKNFKKTPGTLGPRISDLGKEIV